MVVKRKTIKKPAIRARPKMIRVTITGPKNKILPIIKKIKCNNKTLGTGGGGCSTTANMVVDVY